MPKWASVAVGLSLSCGVVGGGEGQPSGAGRYPSKAGPPAPVCGPATQSLTSSEVSPLGFSGEQVLARLSGSTHSALEWIPVRSNFQYPLVYGPEAGTTGIDVGVDGTPGEVLYHYQSPLPDAPAGTDCSYDGGSLSIPALATIRSAELALDETFTTTLETRVPYRASFGTQLTVDQLSGQLEFTGTTEQQPRANDVVGIVSLGVAVWEGGSAGQLWARDLEGYLEPLPQAPPGFIAAREVTGNLQEAGVIASWPSAESCGGPWTYLGSEQKVMGFSARDVLVHLEGFTELSVTWSDGPSSPLSLEFVGLGAALCQALEDRLQFELGVRARSDDGRINAELPVRLYASAGEGDDGVGEVQVSRAGPRTPLSAADLVAAGALGVEWAGYEQVTFDIEMAFPGSVGGAVTGSLSVSGVGAGPTSSVDGLPIATRVTGRIGTRD